MKMIDTSTIPAKMMREQNATIMIPTMSSCSISSISFIALFFRGQFLGEQAFDAPFLPDLLATDDLFTFCAYTGDHSVWG